MIEWVGRIADTSLYCEIERETDCKREREREREGGGGGVEGGGGERESPPGVTQGGLDESLADASLS